jgi:hypothetical protein
MVLTKIAQGLYVWKCRKHAVTPSGIHIGVSFSRFRTYHISRLFALRRFFQDNLLMSGGLIPIQ